MDSPKIPGKEDYKQVKKLMEEWMPKFTQFLFDIIDVVIEEEQDMVIVVFGPPGRGKSNLSLLINTLLAYYMDKKYGLKDRFSLDYAEWKGLKYLKLFKEPAEDLISSFQNKADEEILKKWRGKIFWLDEAADFNALEHMTLFNRNMNKFLATLRALQLIYVWCIDNPLKLLPDIRTYRVTMGLFTIVTPQKRNFGGVIRNVRATAIYGRQEWLKVAGADLNYVRTALVLSQEFLNKFRPWRVEPVPMYPRTPFYYEYYRLKMLKMGERMKESVERIEEGNRKKEKTLQETLLSPEQVVLMKKLGYITTQ